jgi:hypothetical protein
MEWSDEIVRKEGLAIFIYRRNSIFVPCSDPLIVMEMIVDKDTRAMNRKRTSVGLRLVGSARTRSARQPSFVL